MKITYVQFTGEVSPIGSFWSSDKHSKTWSVEEKGSWLVFQSLAEGSEVKSQRRRVPITSVVYIGENGAAEATLAMPPAPSKGSSKAGV